jgi:hypothetical protein
LIYRFHYGNYTVVAKLGLSIPLALILTSAFNPTTFPPTSYSVTNLQSSLPSTSYTSGSFPKVSPKNLHACCVSSTPVTSNSLPYFTNLIRDWVPRVNHELCTSCCNFFFAENIPLCYQTNRKQNSL